MLLLESDTSQEHHFEIVLLPQKGPVSLFMGSADWFNVSSVMLLHWVSSLKGKKVKNRGVVNGTAIYKTIGISSMFSMSL